MDEVSHFVSLGPYTPAFFPKENTTNQKFMAVGFTGSGQPMRKEISVRGKHVYQQGDAEED